MTVSIADFWKLAIESRLLAAADCQRFDAAFAHVKGAAGQGNAVTLGEWLVAGGALSRYQVKTLLAGKPGPFLYGDYCVYDRIRSKEGRLGRLFRAVHLPTRHPVLLSFLTGPIVEEPQRWWAAVQQIAWACWVGHPFVSECYQLLDLGQFKLVALENLVGDTVAARLAGNARLSPPDACRLLHQAALGLSRLHQLGQVHGEIRPDNLWLDPTGYLKLLQVPLAPEPLCGPGPIDWTAPDPTGKLLAAADYAAPELAQPGRPSDATTDIYALGATLFQMLTGWQPFPGGDVANKLSRHAAEPIPSLEPFGVPPQLAQVLIYMMAKDPATRYQQAAQVAEALAYFVDPAALTIAPPTVPTASAFDQWLQQQPRVPGAAPGSIPTATQLAAYSTAQYEAAQSAAAQQQLAAQQIAAQYAEPAHEAAPQYDAPQYNMPPVEPPQAPIDSPPFDFAAAHREEQFAQIAGDANDFTAPATPEPAFFESAPYQAANYEPAQFDVASNAPAVETAAEPVAVPAAPAPRGLNLDAVMGQPTKGTAAAATVRKPTPRKKKSDTTTMVIIGGVIAVLLLVAGIMIKSAMNTSSTPTDDYPGYVAQNNPPPANVPTPKPPDHPIRPPVVPDKTPPTEKNPPQENPTKTPTPKPPDKTPPAGEPVPDDGTALWASPTSGKPLALNYVASGAQAVLAIRPGRIVRRPDGDQLVPALGPWGDMAAKMLADVTGQPLAQIDMVEVVWLDPGTGPLVPMVVIRTDDKLAPESLLAAWGNPAAATEGSEAFYQGRVWSYYLPVKEQAHVLVIGPVAQIKEVIQAAGAAPPMSRYLERLLLDSDADRDVNFAFLPGTTLTEGSPVFFGELAALRKPAADFFGDQAHAALVSLHFQGDFFLELRVVGSGDKAKDLSDSFATRVRGIPTSAENTIDDLNLLQIKYSRKILRRFPEQLRLLADETRNNVEDDLAVVRSYLPGVAAHNLLMGTELALAEQPMKGGPAGGPAKTQTLAETLKQKTTLTFARDTLEKSLQMLFQDLGVQYEILGNDLQLEGITKNQSFGLDEKDEPADEILRKIMLKANADGKLVYILKPKQPGGPEMVFITTRAAAAKRGDKLPAELDTGPGPKKPPKKKP